MVNSPPRSMTVRSGRIGRATAGPPPKELTSRDPLVDHRSCLLWVCTLFSAMERPARVTSIACGRLRHWRVGRGSRACCTVTTLRSLVGSYICSVYVLLRLVLERRRSGRSTSQTILNFTPQGGRIGRMIFPFNQTCGPNPPSPRDSISRQQI